VSATACPAGGTHVWPREGAHYDDGRCLKCDRAKYAPYLSRRQCEVLRLIQAGHATAGIADALGVSHYTARDHIRRLARILDCGLPDMPRTARARGIEF
jgi:DNA-binding CsgD family transcriptional regulator